MSVANLGTARSVFQSSEARLFLAAFTALFAELLLIRWLPLQIRLLAYYSNFILLSALLGFGIGLILASKQQPRLVKNAPYIILILLAFVLLISQFNLLLPLAVESNFIWNGLSRAENVWGPFSYLVLGMIFLGNTLLFAVFAHEMGYWFAKLPPLKAYSIDISGSVCGVLAFAAVSAFSLPPFIWFTLLAAVFFLHAFSSNVFRRREGVVALLAFACVVIVIFSTDSSRDGRFYWSPYYEIEVQDLALGEQKLGTNILVNKDSHQQMLDLSGQNQHPFLEGRKAFYELPYTFLEQAPSDVLVLGAGTGNDVAAALRSGAKSVDAVEIDPIIAKIGEEHPEQPYANPRVSLIVDDARAYLERTDNTYDIITFGFLDSHRLFSSMSSVRLDNYLYTVENMENIEEQLQEGGVLAISYTVHEQWIADRLFNLLSSSFNQVPVVYQGDEAAWGTIFLVRKGTPLSQPDYLIGRSEFEATILPAAANNTWAYSKRNGFLSPEVFSSTSLLPTDDWPHLYMEKRGIPANYLAILVLIFSFSLLLVGLQIPKLAFRSSSSWNFFFLGAGFALLETKGISELAIVLGSTWVTNAVVITGILLMILLANILVLKRVTVPPIMLYAALVATLLFSFFFSFTHLFVFEYSTRVILAGFQVGLPIFFSGLLFSLYLQRAQSSTIALGANLLGAMFGGLFEYTSLIVGQSALFLVAIAFYVSSFGLYIWEQQKERLANNDQNRTNSLWGIIRAMCTRQPRTVGGESLTSPLRMIAVVPMSAPPGAPDIPTDARQSHEGTGVDD